ncbi:MAG TPA: hypothetical protein VIM93_00270 [Kangiella sp.]
MDDIKLKAIEYFASKPHDDEKAKKFLTREYNTIQQTLRDSNDFDEIHEACRVLQRFISHVAENAIEDINSCWERLHALDDGEVIRDYFSRYQTKERLYSQLINLLNKLRYLEQDKIMPLLINFWINDELVRDDIEKVFKELSQFNLNAYEQIGFRPQLKLLKFTLDFSDEEKINLFPIVITIFGQLLSTELEGAQWNYRTVTITSTGIPPSDDLREIRNKTVSSLIDLYQIAEQLNHKISLLNLMNNACRIWSRKELHDSSKLIVEQNSVQVLTYWASLAQSEKFQLVQKIEHDAYWSYYHTSSDKVLEAALNVKNAIDDNLEYQIYRDLVGFDSVFIEWDKESGLHDNYKQQQKIRERRIKAHIGSVTSDNISIWLERVELFLETESNDLATFPELLNFLFTISKRFPTDVLSRLQGSRKLDKGAIAIIRGLWSSSIHHDFVNLVEKWIETSSYHWELSRAFINIDDIKPKLLDKFVDKLILEDDRESLSSILRIFNTNKPQFANELINKEIYKIFSSFIESQYTGWINEVWFVQFEDSFISILDKANLDLILKSLVYANDIEYHIEYILKQVAEINVEYVFSYLAQRVVYFRDLESDKKLDYRPIPYGLNTLGIVLSNYPDKLIGFIAENYKHDIIRGSSGVPSLFRKCFQRFKPDHVGLILGIFDPKKDSDFQIIIDICDSYHGDSSILPLVREVIANTTIDSERHNKLFNSLLNTGVISGDYGRVKALEKKVNDISSWETDSNQNVVDFAERYTEILKERIENEIKRVEERIAIEKHIYGDGS